MKFEVFLIFNRRFIILIMILIFITSTATANAAESNITHTESDLNNGISEVNTIYVNPDAEANGDGSMDSPYSSLNNAVKSSVTNTTIILEEGIYKGNSNTQITINNTLTIEGNGNVIIDGENKFSFFKITPKASLTLKNIRFINGYTNDYSQLAMINNNGYLKIDNCSFNTMNSIFGVIFNQKNFLLVNTTISNSKASNLAQVITNLANCTVIDSKLTQTYVYSTMDISATIYNYHNLNITDSQVDEVDSNSQYDEISYTASNIFIKNSLFNSLSIDDAEVIIDNSQINDRASFRNTDIRISQSRFNQLNSIIGLSVHYSNFTAYHTIFNTDISSGYSNLNITYSAVLKNMYGGGKYDNLYAPYNWWGINSGPSLSYFKNYNITYWAVATFEYENESIPVNPTGVFTVGLNKWSDGNNTYKFKVNESIPLRYVSFESQSGKFDTSGKILDKQATNHLTGNTVDGKVYAIVDRQRLVLNVGNSLSDVTYYVSPDGHDGPEDGSREKPFLTLQYAVSKVGNGNTICILGGVNRNPANSDVVIDKNITITGINDPTIVRANSHTMFNVREWGSLTIKNINFQVDSRDYSDSIFHLTGGNLRIVNSTFTSITSEAVIYAEGGVENTGTVTIEDSKFHDIKGSAVRGVSKSVIINTTFEKFTNYYRISGFESYNCIFPLKNSIEIYNSKFKNNNIGIVNLHPFYYSRSTLLGAYSSYFEKYAFYAYVENSLFENNQFGGVNDAYSTSGTGFLIHDDYGSYNGFINNCTFIKNSGPIANANNINNSVFIENTGASYSGQALVKADEIYNSNFIRNTNLYKDGEGALIGEGIASADLILNSSFEYNKAAFGGAVANTKEIHYSVFVNNTAVYGGSDVFSSSGDVDYSTNWWGDNQKPGSDKIFKFLGTLTLSDWIIMSLKYTSNKQITASLMQCINQQGEIQPISNFIHKRQVYFEIENGEISPEITTLNNGAGIAMLNSDFNKDFKAYATVDNQRMEVNVRNTHTEIIITDAVFKGRDNRYSINLVNVNGFKISNQTLVVEIIDENDKKTIFTLLTDDNGHAEFNVDYPVGKYIVNAVYLGNGYFTKSSAIGNIEVVMSPTFLISYNHTYYGKTNRFSAILTGENDKKLNNLTLSFTIFNSKGQSTSYSITDNYGVGEIVFTLDVGEYQVLTEFKGDSWYSYCNSTSHITVNPVNTTLSAPNVTLYGEGNVYSITLKDIYGNLIIDENIYLALTQG